MVERRLRNDAHEIFSVTFSYDAVFRTSNHAHRSLLLHSRLGEHVLAYPSLPEPTSYWINE
jgi:hypothetical protein